MIRLVAVAATAAVALVTSTAASAATWSPAAPIPGATSNFSFTDIPLEAAVAGNGDAAVAWTDPQGRGRVAIRSAGVWAVTNMTRLIGGPVMQITLAMNQRGDLAVVYVTMPGGGPGYRTYLAYKPADGLWQLPAAEAPASTRAMDVGRPSVAINAAGDAVAAWLEQSTSSTLEVRASTYDRPAVGTATWTPSAAVDPSLSGVTALVTFLVGPSHVPVAIDDAGNTVVAFTRQYGTYEHPTTMQTRPVHSVRFATGTVGGAWSASSPLTPEPGGVTYDSLPSTPSFRSPVLAADPSSGRLAAAIIGREGAETAQAGNPPDYTYDNPPVWLVDGTVAAGPAGRTNTQHEVLGTDAAGAAGLRIAGGLVREGAGGGPYNVNALVGTAGAGPSLALIESPASPFPTAPFDIDLAAGSGGLLVAGAGSAGGVSGPTWVGGVGGFGTASLLWPDGTASRQAVGANCRGDAIAAIAHNAASPGPYQILFADYLSGVTEPCGGAVTPTPTATASPTTTATAAPSASASPTVAGSPVPSATATASPSAVPTEVPSATATPVTAATISLGKLSVGKLKGKPKRARVSLAFIASEPVSCKLDGAKAKPCSSPVAYRVSKGRHTIRVSAGRQVSRSRSFTVKKPG